ncbi:MAG TPA: transporter substrate-binding domain-containing protein [Proteiniclasticum sp.]|nr:transporter substrate-binding domain-containing protein [Proteiniclasticum sp.]
MLRRVSMMIMVIMSAIFILAGCGTKIDAEGDGVFKVGMEAGYAPFNWTQNDDANGAVKILGTEEFAAGYDVEIAKKIAEGLGEELVIVKVEWDGLVPALKAGTIDAIVAGMSPTEKRKESIDFTDNYYMSDLVLVVAKDGEYTDATSLSDFSGAKVTAQLNTFHYDVIDQIEGVEKQTAMDNFSAIRVALESGVIDAYVTERPEAVSASAANEKFMFVELTDGFETSPDDTAIAVGINKGNDALVESINSILGELSVEDQQSIMDQAILNQPSAE